MFYLKVKKLQKLLSPITITVFIIMLSSSLSYAEKDLRSQKLTSDRVSRTQEVKFPKRDQFKTLSPSKGKVPDQPENPGQSDIEVIKDVFTETAQAGDIVTYDVTIINHGGDIDSAYFVNVEDNLPLGLEIVQMLPYEVNGGVFGVNLNYDQNGFQVSIDEMQTNASIIITFKALVLENAIGEIVNVASLVSVLNGDKYPPNNSDDATIFVITEDMMDLKITKDGTLTSQTGDSITLKYCITIQNCGPATATNINAIDYLNEYGNVIVYNPPHFAYVTDIQGNVGFISFGLLPDENEIYVTIGEMGPNSSITFCYEVSYSLDDIFSEEYQMGFLSNTITLTDYEPTDYNLLNNQSTYTGFFMNVDTNNEGPDLGLTKELNIPNANVGDIISFNLAAFNIAEATLTNVSLVDMMSEGLCLTSEDPIIQSFLPEDPTITYLDEHTFKIEIAEMPQMSGFIMTYKAEVKVVGHQFNQFWCEDMDQEDIDLSNNYITVFVD